MPQITDIINKLLRVRTNTLLGNESGNKKKQQFRLIISENSGFSIIKVAIDLQKCVQKPPREHGITHTTIEVNV